MHTTKKSQLQGILSDMDSTCDGVDDLTDYNDAVDELQKVETFCDALEDGRLTNTDDALDDINEKLGENCVDYLEFLDDNALSKSEDVSLIAVILNSILQLIISWQCLFTERPLNINMDFIFYKLLSRTVRLRIESADDLEQINVLNS